MVHRGRFHHAPIKIQRHANRCVTKRRKMTMVPRYTTYAEMYRVIVDSMRSRTRLDLPKLDSVGAIFFRPREIRDDQGQRQRQRQRQRNIFVSSFNMIYIAPSSTRMFLLDVSVEYTRGYDRRRRDDVSIDRLGRRTFATATRCAGGEGTGPPACRCRQY